MRACVRACVRVGGWVGGWVGVCVSVCVGGGGTLVCVSVRGGSGVVALSRVPASFTTCFLEEEASRIARSALFPAALRGVQKQSDSELIRN